MNQPIRAILVGLAALDRDASVLAAAVAIAHESGATLHVMHVGASSHPYAPSRTSDHPLPDHRRRELQARLEQCVGREPWDDKLLCHVGSGAVGECLGMAALTLNADLVIVGDSSDAQNGQRVQGSIAEDVIRTSPVPVLIVRRPIRGGSLKVLFAADVSDLSGRVHETGSQMIERTFTGRMLAYRSLLAVRNDTTAKPPIHEDLLRNVARWEFEWFLDRDVRHGRYVEGHVRVGDPVVEVHAEAAEWEPDLLVVGAHGRNLPARFRLGSTADATVRGVSCNMLVVPAVDRLDSRSQPGRELYVEPSLASIAMRGREARLEVEFQMTA